MQSLQYMYIHTVLYSITNIQQYVIGPGPTAVERHTWALTVTGVCIEPQTQIWTWPDKLPPNGHRPQNHVPNIVHFPLHASTDLKPMTSMLFTSLVMPLQISKPCPQRCSLSLPCFYTAKYAMLIQHL